MGRENRFKNLLTRLNKQANLCKLQSYKHVAINFKLLKQSRFKNLAKYSQKYPYQAQIQSFQPTSCSKIHNQNSCFTTQIIKEQIKLVSRQQVYFWNEVNCFCHVLTFHRWPRQNSILPTLTIALGNYHQFHHTKPLLKV